jgi:hypothetical protein
MRLHCVYIQALSGILDFEVDVGCRTLEVGLVIDRVCDYITAIWQGNIQDDFLHFLPMVLADFPPAFVHFVAAANRLSDDTVLRLLAREMMKTSLAANQKLKAPIEGRPWSGL